MKNIDGNDIKIIGVGIVAAFAIGILLVAIESWLVINGYISNAVTTFIVIAVNLVAMIVSCVIIQLVSKNVVVLHILLIAAGYMLVILGTNLLVYSEGIYNIIYTTIGIIAGVGVNLLRFLQRKPIKSYRRKMRFR